MKKFQQKKQRIVKQERNKNNKNQIQNPQKTEPLKRGFVASSLSPSPQNPKSDGMKMNNQMFI